MSWSCIGCGNQIGWDGGGTLCYTCPCGSHTFCDESGRLAPPASLILGLYRGESPPHLDYLVGKSSYTSPLKERFIQELVSLGAIWMKDCRQCAEDGTYQRVLDLEKAQAVFEADSIVGRE